MRGRKSSAPRMRQQPRRSSRVAEEDLYHCNRRSVLHYELKKTFIIVIEGLFCTMSWDGRGKLHLQALPGLAVFFMRPNFLDVDTGLCEQKRSCEVIPISIAREVEQMQPIPGCREDMASEECTGVCTFLDDTTLAVFNPHASGSEVAATIRTSERSKGDCRRCVSIRIKTSCKPSGCPLI